MDNRRRDVEDGLRIYTEEDCRGMLDSFRVVRLTQWAEKVFLVHLGINYFGYYHKNPSSTHGHP